MKKILLTATAVMAFGLMQAQEVKYGAKVGLNISTLTGDIENTNNKIGFHIGGFAEIKVSDKFSVQPEILYSSQGTKGEETYTDLSGSFKVNLTQELSYLNIPVMAKYYVAEKFYLEAGPQIGFLLSAEQKGEASGIYNGQPFNVSQTVDNKDTLNSTDFGLNFGLGFNISKNVGAGVRYTAGLSNLDKETENSTINNSNIGISILYTF